MSLPPLRANPRDGWLLVLVIVLALGTALVVLLDDFDTAIYDTRLDLVINTSAALASGAIAALAWGRWRATGQWIPLYQASAFLVLFSGNLIMVIVMFAGLDEELGISLTDPGQFPTYVLVVARLIAAFLLASGAWRVLRGRRPPVSARGVMIWPTAVLVVVAFSSAVRPEALPPLISDAALALLRERPTSGEVVAAAGASLIAAQALIGVIFLLAARHHFALGRREPAASHGYMAAGLVVAAFSQMHSGLHPGAYAGLVTTGDVLRIVFYGILLAGVLTERRTELRALADANAELRRLRDADLARATLEERARLAREVHDGLAQDLWYAKLKQGRLVQTPGLPAEARALAEEVVDAIDAGLADARQAVMAMRAGLDGGTLADVLRGYVEDFGDRYALRTDFVAGGDAHLPGPRAEAEVLRIVQEALNNVRKHADATRVRLEVDGRPDSVRIVVSDNGRGFDPRNVAPTSVGLESMRERAGIVGGRLSVFSEPQNGTRVELDVPRRATVASGAAAEPDTARGATAARAATAGDAR